MARDLKVWRETGRNSEGIDGLIPVKLRPTGLGSGIDKDRLGYGVYSGEWCIAASTRVPQPTHDSGR